MIIIAIETPEYGMSDFERLGLAAGILLAVVAIIIALFVAGQYATLKDRLDSFDDRTTPSFTEEQEPATDEIEAVPPTEAERDPVAVEYREFTRADGSTARFQVRSPQ